MAAARNGGNGCFLQEPRFPMKHRVAQSVCITCRSQSCEHLTSNARTLAPYEVDLIVGVADCLPNKIIAFRLGVAEGTVKTGLHGIYAKMGFEAGDESPRPRLARWARENADLLGGPKAA
jgi:DNA-binding NarL/FixJ family response regulator